tara:strand:+ start:2802 stop:3119 length:318 start_codon:yes stop_codon:yes gene_type:complete
MREIDVDIIAYACWAPSYEVNEIISISNYEIKIKKIIEDKKYGFKYEIEFINVKHKIRNMIVFEEQIMYQEIEFIKQIQKKIKEKKFEVDFMNRILGVIYKNLNK